MTQSFLIDGIGLWAQRMTRADFEGRPAAFLDRDGVIAEEVHFLADPNDVRLTSGIGEAIAALNRMSVAVVLATNQSGIARDRFGWAEFSAVQDEIVRQLARAGAVIDAVFACAYHEAGKGSLGVADHPWRKPRPGMLQEAGEQLGVDFSCSIVIGDRLSDLEAGCAAGVREGVLALTGYGMSERERLGAEAETWRAAGFHVGVCDNAAQAIGRWARVMEPVATPSNAGRP